MQEPDCTTFPETPPQPNARLLSSQHPPGCTGRGRVQLAHSVCTTLKLATTNSFWQASSHLLLSMFPSQ